MKKNILIFAAIVLVVLGYYLIEFFSFDGEVELKPWLFQRRQSKSI